MDAATYTIISAFLFILRIVITVYCVNKAGELKRYKFGWGLFGFILPLVALIWIQFLRPIEENKKTYREAPLENFDYSGCKEINNSGFDFNSQKESLLKLKNEKLLTDYEYQDKLELISKKETEFQNTLEEKRIEGLLKIQLEPIINNLDSLLINGVLNQEEYNAKRDQLYKEKRKQISEHGISDSTAKSDDINIGIMIVVIIIALIGVIILGKSFG